MVERPLQHHNVHPGLVVGTDQIPFIAPQPLQARHVPLNALGQVDDEVVAVDPGLGEPNHQAGVELAPAWPRDDQLDQQHDIEGRTPEQGIQDEQ